MTENVFFLDFLVYVTLADVYKMGKIGFKLFCVKLTSANTTSKLNILRHTSN